MIKLILASKSPRRKEILEGFGFQVEIDVEEVEEVSLKKEIADKITEIALKKVEAVAERRPDEYVVGADTVVVVDEEIIGKPKDEEDVCMILKKLSGRSHKVITAYALINKKKNLVHTDYEITDIRFTELTEEDIAWYISTGEPMDKAGAYGIQGKGAAFIERMEGDFFSTMGFPLGKFVRDLKKIGINLL